MMEKIFQISLNPVLITSLFSITPLAVFAAKDTSVCPSHAKSLRLMESFLRSASYRDSNSVSVESSWFEVSPQNELQFRRSIEQELKNDISRNFPYIDDQIKKIAEIQFKERTTCKYFKLIPKSSNLTITNSTESPILSTGQSIISEDSIKSSKELIEEKFIGCVETKREIKGQLSLVHFLKTQSSIDLRIQLIKRFFELDVSTLESDFTKKKETIEDFINQTNTSQSADELLGKARQLGYSSEASLISDLAMKYNSIQFMYRQIDTTIGFLESLTNDSKIEASTGKTQKSCDSYALSYWTDAQIANAKELKEKMKRDLQALDANLKGSRIPNLNIYISAQKNASGSITRQELFVEKASLTDKIVSTLRNIKNAMYPSKISSMTTSKEEASSTVASEKISNSIKEELDSYKKKLQFTVQNGLPLEMPNDPITKSVFFKNYSAHQAQRLLRAIPNRVYLSFSDFMFLSHYLTPIPAPREDSRIDSGTLNRIKEYCTSYYALHAATQIFQAIPTDVDDFEQWHRPPNLDADKKMYYCLPEFKGPIANAKIQTLQQKRRPTPSSEPNNEYGLSTQYSPQIERDGE